MRTKGRATPVCQSWGDCEHEASDEASGRECGQCGATIMGAWCKIVTRPCKSTYLEDEVVQRLADLRVLAVECIREI